MEGCNGGEGLNATQLFLSLSPFFSLDFSLSAVLRVYFRARVYDRQNYKMQNAGADIILY